MSRVEPSPYICKGCKQEVVEYADGVLWCEVCAKRVELDNVFDRSRSNRWKGFLYNHVSNARSPRPANIPVERNRD